MRIVKRSVDFSQGLLLGLLIGEGHFGVTNRGEPILVVGMHIRHEAFLRHIQTLLPGSILYGPYEYNRRHFFRLQLRGSALCKQRPMLEELEIAAHRPHVGRRFNAMREACLAMDARRVERRRRRLLRLAEHVHRKGLEWRLPEPTQ